MKLQPLIAALQQRARRGMELGLEPTRQALARLGAPHSDLLVVHVAGSNGKGSTAAMVESIARAAGLRTGLYTSPHLCRFAERLRIDGEPIRDEAFASTLERVLGCGIDLTFFESLTVAAFEAFRRAEVDIAVLEVGLGGRLDATNVVQSPLCTAVTSIALEHTDVLGHSLAQIAREKAGIFKPGVPVVMGPLPAEAEKAAREEAALVGAGPIWSVTGEHTSEELGLLGAHQVENAAVATRIARTLAERWPTQKIERAIPAGLRAVRWPGRLERLLCGDVPVLFDCAHNAAGALALARALPALDVKHAKTTLVFGAMRDKAWRNVLELLAPTAHRRIFTSPKGREPAPLDALASVAPGTKIAEPRAALAEAVSTSRTGEVVLVAGSTYLVGELRAATLGCSCDPVIAL